MTVHPFNPNVSPMSYHLPGADSTKPKMHTMFQGEFCRSGTVRRIKWEEELGIRQSGLGITAPQPDPMTAARFRSQFQTRKATKKMK